jgi:hypothetical protein
MIAMQAGLLRVQWLSTSCYTNVEYLCIVHCGKPVLQLWIDAQFIE